MPDDWEKYFGFDPNNATDAYADSDEDGFTNLVEFKFRTNPQLLHISDTDQFIDLRPGIDTDGDGMPNVWEWKHGLAYDDASDADADPDDDALGNLEEYRLGTDPTDSDTDGDSLADGWEAENGLDATNDGSDGSKNGGDGDLDGDGVSNKREQDDGTDATNPDDFPIEWCYVTNRVEGHSAYNANNDPKYTGEYESREWNATSNDRETFEEAVTPAMIKTKLDGLSFPATFEAATSRVERISLSDVASVSASATFYISSAPHKQTKGDFTSVRCWLRAPAKNVERKFHFAKLIHHSENGVSENTGSEEITFTIAAGATVSNGSKDLSTSTESEVGDTHITSVTLKALEIVPDQNMAGVIGDVVQSTIDGSQIKHFVTPKESGQFVELKAGNLDSASFDQLYEWEGEEGKGMVGATANKYKVKRDTPGMVQVRIKAKSGGAVLATMRVWVVWTTVTTIKGTPQFVVENDDPVNGTSKYEITQTPTSVWRFKFKIEPASICDPDEAERPQLSIKKVNDPPGYDKPHALYGPKPGDTATHKWDVSRQMKVTVKNPDGIHKSRLEYTYKKFADGQPSQNAEVPVTFPSSEVEGNDDSPGDDEDANPYQQRRGGALMGELGEALDHEIGELTSIDAPRFSARDRWGEFGKSLTIEINFCEFARVELWDGKRKEGKFWFKISSDSEKTNWHHYLDTTFDDASHHWIDRNSSSGFGHPHP